MGGGLASHGMRRSSHGKRTSVSKEEDQCLMGGGVSSQERRTSVSWEEEYCLMG